MNAVLHLFRGISKTLSRHAQRIIASTLSVSITASVLTILFDPTIGVVLTVFSLLATITLAYGQGVQLQSISQTLNATADQMRKATFNEVTLSIFSNIQKNQRLADRMRGDDVGIKQSIPEVLEATAIDGGTSNLLKHILLGHTIFIESGSTYAYLALHLSEYIDRDEASLDSPQFIYTNNILVVMVLLFQKQCRVWLYPGTSSEDKYGATYGVEYAPESTRKKIDQDELRQFLSGTSSGAKPAELIFLAASKIHPLFGPHVGSKQNAEFKKGLLAYARENGIPTVVIVSHTKIEEKSESPWENGDCIQIYSAKKTDANEHGWNESGFTEFCNDIASGTVFLMVAYHSSKPKHLGQLEARIQEYSKNRSGHGIQTVPLQQGDHHVLVFMPEQDTGSAPANRLVRLLSTKSS